MLKQLFLGDFRSQAVDRFVLRGVVISLPCSLDNHVEPPPHLSFSYLPFSLPVFFLALSLHNISFPNVTVQITSSPRNLVTLFVHE